MCGIVGIVRFDGQAVDREALTKLSAAIAHRGPDDDGLWVEGPVGIAMRRLSIIDLTGGHQPMWCPEKRFVIVFNGEVYNYREIRSSLESLGHVFRSTSDTEVVLIGYREWGRRLLDRMIGMWGVAIYDTQRQELFLARDRLGKKQIYYGITSELLVFGSEMAVPLLFSSEFRRLNREAIPEFLRHGYVGPGRTAVQNVHELAPGHYAIVHLNGRVDQRAYWNIHDQSKAPMPHTEHEAADACYALTVDAVRARLVADVPISVMLSSGLDSSTLAYVLARELQAPLHAFTLGFSDAGFDESRDAGDFAKELGLPWQRRLVTGHDVARDFPRMIGHMSSLQSNTAQIVYYYVNQMIREAGFKVALNGNGGDELFAGYPTYRATRLFDFYRRIPTGARTKLHRIANQLPASFGRVSFDYMLKKFTELASNETTAAHGYWRTMFSPSELRLLLGEEAFPTISSHTELYERTFASFDTGKRSPDVISLLKADMLAWLQPMLPWTDNMSMAHGVELRLPMLDHRLVSYVYGLPERFLFRGWRLKRLMKSMVSSKLPHAVVFRKKRGTHLPISKWLNRELAPIADAYLRSGLLRSSYLVDTNEVERLLGEHRAGKRNNTFKLWNLIVFGAWMQHYQIRGT